MKRRSKVISPKEKVRREALRMRNQLPETIALNRMKMQVHWMKQKGLLQDIK